MNTKSSKNKGFNFIHRNYIAPIVVLVVANIIQFNIKTVDNKKIDGLEKSAISLSNTIQSLENTVRTLQDTIRTKDLLINEYKMEFKDGNIGNVFNGSEVKAGTIIGTIKTMDNNKIDDLEQSAIPLINRIKTLENTVRTLRDTIRAKDLLINKYKMEFSDNG